MRLLSLGSSRPRRSGGGQKDRRRACTPIAWSVSNVVIGIWRVRLVYLLLDCVPLLHDQFGVKQLLVTGSSGLIGIEVVTFFCSENWEVYGLDNNMRRDFFEPQGDTLWNRDRLQKKFKTFRYREVDVRDRERVLEVVAEIRPTAIIHTAA